MKKTTVFILAIFATLFVISCKKDYSCRCTLTYMGVSEDTTFALGNMTKKDAKSECNDFKSTYGGLVALFGGNLDCGVE